MQLQLPKAPQVLFLFGLAGTGKSYIGDLIGKHLHWRVYHADEDLTDEMKQALAQSRPFTDSMRDRYVAILVDKIREMQAQHEHIVVTQGLYKQRHREWLQCNLESIELVCVSASEALLLQRIQERPNGILLESARALFADFEHPDGETKVIDNSSGDDDRLIEQLNRFFG